MRNGYFLNQELGAFDANFFRISRKEAEAMDPQQLILLEVVYEALEDACIPMEEIAGSNTSVWCGSFTNDYLKITDHDISAHPKYAVTGKSLLFVAKAFHLTFKRHWTKYNIESDFVFLRSARREHDN